jgi:DNA-binding response OmpR family regulator
LGGVLVLEDEGTIREFEVINLRRAGYEVFEAESGKCALEIFDEKNGELDLAIIDIMVPEIGGIEVCKEFRRRSKNIGIIILTAKIQEMDKISGLMQGADDYITKPFGPSEFLARVDSLYRRVSINKVAMQNNLSETINYKEFSLNLRTRTFKSNDKEISLTQNEFRIAEYLLSNPNTPLKRSQIIKRVWGDKADAGEKMVDVNMRRLRSKIELDPASPEHIVTVWGVGYKWV